MKNLKGLFLVILFSVSLLNEAFAQIPPPTGGGGGGTVYYLDSDGDGYGDTFTAGVTTQTTGYSVTNNDDCDDSDIDINPDTRWYLDDDDDGYGTNSTSVVQCFQPTGYVLNNTDCNDSDGAVHVNQTWYRDTDGDGYYGTSQTACSSPGTHWSTSSGSGTDCNDNDAAVHVNQTWYQDADGDGYYGTSQTACSSPGSNWSTSSGSGTDCNDADAAVHVNQTWYQDADGDGYYGTSQTACSSPGSNWSTSSGSGTDCNDADAAVHVNQTWYKDSDGDGYYGDTQTSCSSPGSNWSTSSGSGSDCDDTSTSLTTTCTFSSGIAGDDKVAKSLTYTYTANTSVTNGSWSLSGGGTIQSQSSSSVSINWTSSSGTYTLQYGFNIADNAPGSNPGDLRFLSMGSMQVTIYNINTPTITVTEGCNQSTITHNGSQSSVTFYWRSPGSSAYNVSTVTRTVTAEGTYYIRGYHSAGVWGPIRTATVTHNDPPTWYEDFDGDGYYGDTRVQCSSPGANWSTSAGSGVDCNDQDEDQFTSAHCNPQTMAPLGSNKYLERGAAHTFTWLDPSNGSTNYKIWIGGEPMNNGNWVTGNSFAWTPNSTYSNIRIRVESQDGNTVFQSDAFDVVPPIAASSDKSKYYPSQTINASWTGGKSNETYTIELIKGSTVISTKTSSGSSTTFALGTNPSLGTNYKVRVRQTTSNRLSGSGSDDTGSITVYKALKVTYPNASGLSFPYETVVPITWEGENESGTYTISVMRGSTVEDSWAVTNVTSYNWTVDNGEFPVGTNYKIKVTQESYNDQSNNNFEIKVADPQQMFPLGSDKYLERGAEYTFTWLDPSSGTINYKVWIGGEPMNDGNWVTGNSFDWTPNSTHSNIKIRVESQNQDIVFESDAFDVVAPIVASVDELKYYPSGTIEASWTGGRSTETYTIELIKGSSVVLSQTSSSTSTTFALGTDPDIGTNYKVRVRQTTSNRLSGSGSDDTGSFTVFEQLKVLYPNASGLSFPYESVVPISWEGEDESGTYTISVMRGATVEDSWTVTDATSYNWTVDNGEFPVATNYKIKVEQGGEDDQSNNNFEVKVADPQAMAPLSSGKFLERGSEYRFLWLDPSGGSVNYKIWIGDEPMNEGNWVTGNFFDWTPNSTYSNIKIRVESEDQDKVFESATFDVVAPIVASTNESKYYPSGTITATWTGGSSDETYTIELYKGSEVLETNTSNATSTTFDLSASPDIGTDYRVKVYQNTANRLSGTGADFSPYFTVYKQLKVTFPDGNESFVFGEEVNITWEGEDEEGLYDIYILADGVTAVTWVEVSGTSLDPDWTVTKSETGVGANYTVQVVQGSYDDESDDTFTIGFPSAEAMTPSQGDILAVGQTVPLSWSGPVTSDYNVYLDGTLLITVTGNSYDDWTLQPTQIGEEHQIRVESIDGTAVSESGTFEIAPQIAVATVGPVVMLGETLFLNWAGGTPHLDYVVELIGGASPINLYTGPDFSFNYLVPGSLELGTGYQIRVSQNENLEGTSSPSFEVTECTIASSASADQNYVKTYTARTNLGPCMANADDPFLVQEAISYVDGLGRPIQVIQRNATPADVAGNTYDLITHFDYDEFGRQDKNYLPHPGAVNTGAYQNTAQSDQQAYYATRFDAEDGVQAFSQQIFEPSPLNRVTKSAAPGDTWKATGEHTVDTDYQLNDGTQGIRFLLAEGTTIENYGTYTAGELSILKTSDENNDIVESNIYKEGIAFTYTNRKGQVILKQTRLNGTEYASTYYIYDDYGNLRHVIQPEGVRIIDESSNTIDWTNSINDENFRKNWMFSYDYDSRQRMIAKRVPGADWIRMIYDERDRLVLTQDGNQNLEEFTTEDIILDGSQDPLDPFYEVHGATIKLTGNFHVTAGSGTTFRAKANPGIADGGWIFTKYDELNRPVLTGRMERRANPTELEGEAVSHYTEGVNHGEAYTGSGDLFGYTNHAFPTEYNVGEPLEEEDLLTVTYYDTYDFTGQAVPVGARTQIKGQVTGSKTRLLGTDTWLTSITYYDNRYRVLMTVSDNYLGGKDTIRMSYRNTISPLISMTETRHTGGEDVIIVEQYAYDHMNRLLTTTHSINGGPEVVIASNTYNVIGELIQKNLGGSSEGDVTPVQSVDYDYNIRGWLTSINNGDNYDPEDDKFGMRLSYDDAPAGFEQYNGNIGQMLWRSQGGGLQTTAQNYVYTYDPSSRLTSADYTGVGDYDVNAIAYDHNGNIRSLHRNTRDNLTYDYRTGVDQSNQLFSVSDAATADLFNDGNTSGDDYTYDDNGNLIRDLNKGVVSIAYNHLNLPQLVTFENGNTVLYTYDAGGMKLRKVVNEGSNVTTTDYLRGMHFIDNSLTFLQHGEGRAVKDGDAFNYEFNLTDHLGNVRVSVSQPGTVVQRDGYYPFGLTFNSSADSPENLYKYNGFEQQKETGWYDYLARQYDPELGRFTSIDPAADLMRRQGPYNYAFNNPIRFIDPDGMMPTDALADAARQIGEKVSSQEQSNNLEFEWTNNMAINVLQGVLWVGKQTADFLDYIDGTIKEGEGDSQEGGAPVVNNGSPGQEAAKGTASNTEEPIELPYTGVATGWSSPSSKAKGLADMGHRINQLLTNELTELPTSDASNQSGYKGAVKGGEPVEFLILGKPGFDPITMDAINDSIWETVDPISGDIDTIGTRSRNGKPAPLDKKTIRLFLDIYEH